MTGDETIAEIKRLGAAIAEERRKDQEDYLALALQIDKLAKETRAAIARLDAADTAMANAISELSSKRP